jgi:hypothetical protein
MVCRAAPPSSAAVKPDGLRAPVEASPLRPYEYILAGSFALAIVVAIVGLFLFQVSSAGIMLEYIFKFLPAMTDGGLASLFDGNTIGDPRPRLLTTFFTYVNVTLRRALLQHWTIHPTLGIAWLIYPICVGLMHRVTLRLTLDARAASIAAILYAASPAMLDVFANYYVPAKPLVSLMMLLAMYGACIVFPASHSNSLPRPILGFGIMFMAGLLGLLADETAVFIFACMPIIFIDHFFDSAVRASRKWLFALSLTASLLVFLFVAFVLVPAVNLALGQTPIDLWTTITRGVYDAMFLTSSQPVGDLIAKASPGTLFETIVSAHAVPHRFVQHIWTSGHPLPHFFQWRWTDQLGLYLFAAIVIFLVLKTRADRARWVLIGKLLLAFLVFVLVESILILRLSPWIVEVNYYAAFSSLFLSLILAVMIAGLAASRWNWAVWLITAYLATVQFVNYWETSQRHPSIRSAPLSWIQLRDVHQKVAAGDFANVASQHPFPSQLFSYGFEHAAALEHAGGRRVDLQPMRHLGTTIFGLIDLNTFQDPNIKDLDVTAYDENSLRSIGAKFETGRVLASRLVGRTIRGLGGDWNFIRHFSRSGEVHERIWRQGLMRVWARKGTVAESDGELCVDFPSYPQQCIARVYEWGEGIYAFSKTGTPITAFRWLPAEAHLPPDLVD